MFDIGQPVMVIGDITCPVGLVSTISEVMAHDAGDHGIVHIYGLAAKPTRNGRVIYFQEQHLMPLDDFETTVGELVELEMPA